jgi:hypothetical protein
MLRPAHLNEIRDALGAAPASSLVVPSGSFKGRDWPLRQFPLRADRVSD